jgi:parallel beta-helix repeat protein
MFVVSVFILSTAGSTCSNAADAIIVSPDPSIGDFTDIQSAIDASGSGDTLLVMAGTYSEAIIVDKSISIIGEDPTVVLIDGGGAETVVMVTADGVNLTGLSIMNSLTVGSGILVMGVSDVRIEDLNISQTGNGIQMVGVSQTEIEANNISDVSMDGMRMEDCDNSSILENILQGCDGFGMNLTSSRDNLIAHNGFIDCGARNDSSNAWNLSYPEGGNFWHDLVGPDAAGGPDQDVPQPDGIVDDPYSNITSGTSMDHYPLVDDWPLVDIYPPVIRLDSPTNGTVIDRGDPILFDVWDVNLRSVSYSLDGVWMSEMSSPYSVNTSTWTTGHHELILRANDTFDNERQLGLSYTVESSDFVVASSIPIDSAVDISTSTLIMIFFSQSLDPSSLGMDNYSIMPQVDLGHSLSANNTVLTLTPSGGLLPDTTYTLTLNSSLLSSGGLPLEPEVITFTTAEVEVEVTGRLLDVYGSPVPHAEVRFNGTDGPLAEVESGEDGVFELGIGEGEYNVTALMEGEVIFETNSSIMAPGPIDLGDWDTMWDPGPIGNGTVFGRLLDVNEDPVEGAEVIFESGGSQTTNGTGPDGRFEVEVPYGQYNITVIKEEETIYEGEAEVSPPGPIDLGDVDTMWDPGPSQPLDPFIPIIIILLLIMGGLLGYGWYRRSKPEGEEREPPSELEMTRPITEEPDYHETELKPPVITSYSGSEEPEAGPETVFLAITEQEGKGRPCREIMEQASSAEETGSLDRAVEEADGAVKEAERAVQNAERRAREAREESERANRDLEEAREEQEREVLDPQRRAEEAERRVSDIEQRLQEMRDNLPGGDDVSFEPRPGWLEAGVGMGNMLHPVSIWYRDRDAMNEHTDRLRRIYYDEYKPLEAELERAREAAEEARRAAEEASTNAEEMERRLQELESRAEETRGETERAEQELQNSRNALEDAEQRASEAREESRRARERASEMRGDARDCEECLQDVQDLLAQIASLIESYGDLKGGEAIQGYQNSLDAIDGEETWDDWWDSFKRFRDEVKQMMDIKGLTDAQIPSQFSGVWDWGGPVGVAVGYGAEDVAGAVIPTDTIRAVGELYRVFQALFDPNTALGSRVLMEQLGADDAPRAASAFNDFPQVLRDAIGSFEELQELKKLESEISSMISGWRSCFDALPPVLGMPSVDMDALCLQQCRDKRAELEDLKERLEDLIEQAETCEPEGLEDKIDEAEGIKRWLRGMITRMNRTREGLELYRRAHRQHFQNKGCFIATAAYATPMAVELDNLRWFRDEILSKSTIGRWLIELYGENSPPIAERISNMEGARSKVRDLLAIAIGLVEKRKGATGCRGALLTLCAILVYIYGSVRAWQMSRRS